jgi:hypothetical protein
VYLDRHSQCRPSLQDTSGVADTSIWPSPAVPRDGGHGLLGDVTGVVVTLPGQVTLVYVPIVALSIE